MTYVCYLDVGFAISNGANVGARFTLPYVCESLRKKMLKTFQPFQNKYELKKAIRKK